MPEPTSVPQEIIDQIRAQAQQEALSSVFGDKYKDLESAKTGVFNQQNSAAQLQQQMNELMQTQIALNQRVDVGGLANNRAQEIDPYQKLRDENLIDPETLRRLVRNEAKSLVDERFNPLIETMEARSRITQDFPDYNQKEPEIMGWLATQPGLYQQVADAQAKGATGLAMRAAYLEYMRSRPAVAEPTGAERVAGALPGGNGSGGVTPPIDTAAQEQELMAAIQRQDERAVYNILFKDSPMKLPPGFRV